MLPINAVPRDPDTETSHAVDIVFVILVARYVCYLGSVFYLWLVSRSSHYIVLLLLFGIIALQYRYATNKCCSTCA
jgi:hypothetical protein